MIEAVSELAQRDARVMWHPYTQMQLDPQALPIVRGEGTLLFDEQGRSYIDAISSWWVNLHGHAHPHIVQAISDQARQLEQVIFAGFTHEPAIRLAERLLSILPPGLSRIFYSDDGSTAVEVALKMALQYWQNLGGKRTRILAFEGGYHGDTFGAMAAGRGLFSAPFDRYLFQVNQLPFPMAGAEERAIATLRAELQRGDVAALIYEPLLQGAGGMRMISAVAMAEVLSLARSQGVLLIADEVMTGFGRTGRLFASQTLGVNPDLICLSKGITGGFMPLGVTAASEQVYNAFLSQERLRMFIHGHSFTANPLACAAANASLDLLLQDETLRAISRIGAAHAAFLKRDNTSFAKNIRLCGTVMAFEVASTEGHSYTHALRDRLYQGFLAQRVLLRPLGNTLYVLPPYCISDAELQMVYAAIESVVKEAIE